MEGLSFVVIIAAALVLQKAGLSCSETLAETQFLATSHQNILVDNPFVPINITENNYSGNVSSRNGVLLLLFIFKDSPDKIIHLTASADKKDGALVTFFFSQSNNYSLSWKLPYTSKLDGVTYWTSSKYLCMDSNKQRKDVNDTILVLVSTTYNNPIKFSVKIQPEPIKYLGDGDSTNLTILANHPQIVQPKFDSKNLLMRITSDDLVCTVVSIQGSMCPINDVEDTIFSNGFWYTMTNKSGMPLMSKNFPNGGRIVFIVLSDNSFCNSASIEKHWHNTTVFGVEAMDYASEITSKTIRISFKEDISMPMLNTAIFVPLAILIAAVAIMLVVWISYFGKTYRSHSDSNQDDDERLILISSDDEDNFLNERQSSDQPKPPTSAGHDENSASTNSRGFIDGNGGDSDDDGEDSNSRNFTQSILESREVMGSQNRHICDNRENELVNNDSHSPENGNSTTGTTRTGSYVFMVVICFFYYVIPVFQIVIKYQYKLYESGNMDLCYYNFWCAHPLWIFNDFNHVYSNLAYIVLGVLFTLVTFMREKDYRKQVAKDRRYEHELGIPAHFGFYYSMGIGLIMEGILSGLYHVCPSQANFQFDTFFMYVNAAVCLVKLYHGRHPQKFSIIKYSVFLMLPLVSSLVPLYDFLGKYFPFWAPIAAHLFVACVLVYYGLRRSSKRRVFIGGPEEDGQKTLDNYVTYFLILFTSLGIAIIGPIISPANFATYLLIVYLANLILYFIIYVVKKAIYGESILRRPLISWALIAFLFWAISGAFFLQPKTSWEVSPADARTKNEECTLFQFYDTHDIWHFFSAFAMFFSFMVLLTLDDDRISTRRTEIRVF